MSDIYRLDGSLSLVSGASKGIGAGIAKALARQGSDILLLARNIQAMESVAADIRTMGRKVKAFQVDLSDEGQVECFFEAEAEMLKRLDHYVNNAAFTIYKSFMQSSLDDFDSLVATNVKATISLVQRVAKHMKVRGQGTITYITSINALSPLPSQAMYSATKVMLEALMKTSASELAQYGIRVNSVVPGAILTDMNPHFTPEKLEELSHRIPCGRVGMPDDIADVVAFLCSDAARYIYGSSLVVDGGWLLRP